MDTILERLPYSAARWLEGSESDIDALFRLSSVRGMEDGQARVVGLFDGEWSLKYAVEKYPLLQFKEMPE